MVRPVEQGLRISEYVLLEKLGQGGFGEVWKAEHTQIPGKFVAVKIPTRPESMDLIRREAVFQHQLEHPNIVRTIGLDVQHDPPYFIMEFVDGRNLRRFMADEGILPPPYAIDVAVQILEALSYAHSRGIVHKDVKPENILVEKRRISVAERGKAFLHLVKITDLGLGNRPDRSEEDLVLSETRTSGMRQMSGTLFYMAPEQMAPGRGWDARADIYSVGVCLYEMLTGELPLGMDLPSELNPVVPPELDHICKKALSINREQRYATAHDMAADLQRAKESFLFRLVQPGALGAKPPSGGEIRPLPVPTPPGRPAPPRPEGTAPLPAVPKSRRLLEWAILVSMGAFIALSAYAFLRGRQEGPPRSQKTDPTDPTVQAHPLRVETVPSGADLFLDGRRSGTTPCEITATYERHTLRIAREFFHERVLEIVPRTVDGRPCFAVLDSQSLEELGVREAASGALPPVTLTRQKGTLRIGTPGLDQVLVHLDGMEVGVTPLELKDIEAGGHVVKLTKDRHRPLEFDVMVRAGSPVVREIALLPEIGETPPPESGIYHAVSVRSTPAGAMVYLNEAEKGPTPCEVELADGSYRLRLELKYHDVWEETVKVAGALSFLVPMVRIRGSVSFESDPPGAMVIVDGQERGEAPTTETLDGGPHVAEFVLDGHIRRTVNFEVVDRTQLVSVRTALQKIPPGQLVVECEIPDVEVFVDEKSVGRAPTPKMRFETGTRKIRVLGVEQEVDVDPGGERRIVLTASDLGMVLVRAGEFEYGSPEPFVKEHRLRKEFLPDYYIDVCEVTNGEYALFWAWMTRTNDHSKCDPAEGRKKNHRPRFWDNEQYRSYLDPKMPVVGVDWYDAAAYAAWAGKRLPTEREWEKAARGTDGRVYPWGSEWNPLALNWGDNRGEKDGWDGPAPVGTYPLGRSPYGCLDMAGNVAEWCANFYDQNGTTRVYRGGSFREKEWIKVWSRDFDAPTQAMQRIGFRCLVEVK